MVRCFLFVALVVVACLGSNTTYSIVRHGGAIQYNATLSDSQVTWYGVGGVWKEGLWQSGEVNMYVFNDLVEKFVASFPRHPIVVPRPSPQFTLLHLETDGEVFVADTRLFVSNAWSRTFAEFVSLFELLLDDVPWQQPVPPAFQAPSVIEYQNPTVSLALFANGTGLQIDASSHLLKRARNLAPEWPSIVNHVLNKASFYGFEQWPINASSADASISVIWASGVRQTLQFARHSNLTPSRLRVLSKFLENEYLNRLQWGKGKSLLGDRGQAAAIACAVVFGVLTLAVIGIAAWRYSHQQEKVPQPKEALDHALSLYDGFDSDEEGDENSNLLG